MIIAFSAVSRAGRNALEARNGAYHINLEVAEKVIGCLFGQRLLVLGVVYGSTIDENVQLLTGKPLGSGVDGLFIGII